MEDREKIVVIIAVIFVFLIVVGTVTVGGYMIYSSHKDNNNDNNANKDNKDNKETLIITDPITLTKDAKCGSSLNSYCPKGQYCSPSGWCGGGDDWKIGKSPYRICIDDTDTRCIKESSCKDGTCQRPSNANTVFPTENSTCGTVYNSYCPKGKYCSAQHTCFDSPKIKIFGTEKIMNPNSDNAYRLCNDDADTNCIKQSTCNSNGECPRP